MGGQFNQSFEGYGSFVVLEGYFNLGGSQRIRWSDLKLSETPTTMNDEKFKAMTDKLGMYAFYRRCRINICLADKINDMQGMPPLETLNLGQAMATNKEKLNIQTGQVVEFVSYHSTLGVIPWLTTYYRDMGQLVSHVRLYSVLLFVGQAREEWRL